MSWVSRMPLVAADQRERGDRLRLGRRPDAHHRAVRAQHPQVAVVVVRRADRVDDQIEPLRELLERRRIGRQREVGRAELLRVGGLLLRRAQHRDLGAHRGRELDRHVAEPAEPDDTDPVPGLALPLDQRRVRRDAGAQERCRARGIEVARHLQHELLGDDDLLRVTAVGRRLAIHLGAVVRRRAAALAELLVVLAAVRAVAARIDEAADAGEVTDLHLLDVRADVRDPAHDLVARDHREDRLAPLFAGLMDVRMADAAEQNIDLDVVRADRAALDRRRSERLFRGRDGIDSGLHAGSLAGYSQLGSSAA
jgi:hypothetical protein